MAGSKVSATGRAAVGLARRHALWVIVGIGAALRFATIEIQDFWLDEHVTLDIVTSPPRELLDLVVAGESNPPLYYMLAGAWESIFGDSEAGIRSFSAVLGTATIPVVYAATRALASRRAALIAAGLAATSPILIWYSQEIRNYSLFVFLAALSFLCFARAQRESPQRDERGVVAQRDDELDDGASWDWDGRLRGWGGWLWGWAVASALMVTTHYFAVFLIAPQAAWLLVRRAGARLEVVLASATIAVVGIALLPLLVTQHGRGDWIGTLPLGERLLQLPAHLLVGLQVPWPALPVVAVVGVAAVAAYGFHRATRAERRAGAIAAGVCLLAVGLALVAVLAGEDFLVTRNILAVWVPFTIALAVLLGARAAGALGIATAVCLCLAGVGLAIWTAVTPEAQRPSYSELAEEVGTSERDRLLISQSSFSSPLTIYLDGAHIEPGDELATSELVVVDPLRTESYAVGPCWWLSTCGGVDILPPPRFEPPEEFELRDRGQTRLFEYRIYEAPEPVSFPRPEEYVIPRVFAQPGT